MIRLFIGLIVATSVLIYWQMGHLANTHTIIVNQVLPLESLPWNQGIFFMEMSRIKKSLDIFTGCALESAAIQNPNRTIFMLVDSNNPNYISRPDYLSGLTNLQVKKFNFTKLLFEHIGPELNPVLKLSLKPMQTWSDLSRILLLYEVGGTYFDIDSISVNPIPTEFENLLQTNMNSSLTNCFMLFKRCHPLLDIIFQGQLKKLRKNVLIFFDGPLVTKLARKHCNCSLEDDNPANTYHCPESWNLTVHSVKDPSVLHFLEKPIQHQLWNRSNLVLFPHLFALHLSSIKNIFFDNVCALLQYRHLPKIMASYCPRTFQEMKTHSSNCQPITDYFPEIQEQFRGPIQYDFLED